MTLISFRSAQFAPPLYREKQKNPTFCIEKSKENPQVKWAWALSPEEKMSEVHRYRGSLFSYDLGRP